MPSACPSPFLSQPIHESRRERGFGADDGEVNLVVANGCNESSDGGSGDREVRGEGGGTGIAGSREDLGDGVAAQCPAEGMLAAAASDNQYSHLFLNASVNAWAARLAPSTTSFTTAFASFM